MASQPGSSKGSAIALLVVGLCTVAIPARADVPVWKGGGSYLDLSMLIQVQGRYVRSAGAGTTLDGGYIYFRRLRPAIAGSLDDDWYGIIQIDFGLGFDGQDPKTSIDAAYFEYSGFEDNQQSALKVGSMLPAVGREFLTPAPKLLTVEQTFVGIQWYGTPDYTMGASFVRVTPNRKLSSEVVAGTLSIQQRPDRIWFQASQNQTDSSDNTGYVASGRVDFWPIGEMPVESKHPSEFDFDPSDLARTPGVHLLVSVGGYGWWNNNLNNQPTTACPTTNDNVCPNGLANVDRVYGGEVSGAIIGYGLSLDVEYQRIRGLLDDDTFTGGLYKNGETDLNKLTTTAGFMLAPDLLELAGSFSLLTATNFPSNWYSGRVALNWFVREHSLQFGIEGTRNMNAFGTTNAYENVGRLQAQLAW